MKKITREEMEELALEIEESYILSDKYERGVLDTYLNIFGRSRGIEQYIFAKYGKNLIAFLEEIEQVEKTENGEYILLVF